MLGMLRRQTEITVEGMDALVAWAEGDPDASERLHACEHRADEQKRDLRRALTTAFSTPLEPEDIFELSSGLDEVLNSAKNTVRESEVMGTAPDAAMAEMSRRAGRRHAGGSRRPSPSSSMTAPPTPRCLPTRR